MAADRYGQPGQPAPNGRNSPGPGFRPELPASRGALAIKLNERLLQLDRNCFGQGQWGPASIPAGNREIPERPLLAKQTALADLADLDF